MVLWSHEYSSYFFSRVRSLQTDSKNWLIIYSFTMYRPYFNHITVTTKNWWWFCEIFWSSLAALTSLLFIKIQWHGLLECQGDCYPWNGIRSLVRQLYSLTARKSDSLIGNTYIKVLNTDRRWSKGTCLLICITFRPKNILIIIYQWPISHGRQYR